jgi:hypothetical protein
MWFGKPDFDFQHEQAGLLSSISRKRQHLVGDSLVFWSIMEQPHLPKFTVLMDPQSVTPHKPLPSGPTPESDSWEKLSERTVVSGFEKCGFFCSGGSADPPTDQVEHLDATDIISALREFSLTGDNVGEVDATMDWWSDDNRDECDAVL